VSDYLGGLATRVLAPSSVMQPRVPSRYEPVVEEWIDQPVPVSLSPPQRGEGRGEGPLRLTTLMPPNEPPLTLTLSPLAAGRGDIAEAPVVHEIPAAPPPVVRIERQTREERVEVPVEVLVEVPVEIPVGKTQTITQTRTRTIERLHVRREETIVERHTRTSAPAPVPVEITIGRIDVRAVVTPQPQPPAPKPKPKPRVTSLDEYASGRQGRHR